MFRVKFAEEIFFFILPFWIFSDFELKNFQTFGQKTSRICQNYLLRVQRNNLWLEFFFSFESFRIFCRNLWHGSQKSFYVSRVKIAEEFFFFLPFWFCSDFERKNFQTFGQKTSWICQNYLLRVHSNNLWLEFFFLSFESFRIFCRNLWHGSSKIYPSVQSRNCGLNRFFVFLFRFFFEFWAKNFQIFAQKTSKNCEN